MKEKSDWWKAIAGLAVVALLAVGLGLLFRGQRQTPVATEPTATVTTTCTPTPTMTPVSTATPTPALPTGAPGPRHLSAAVEVQVPQGFRLMDLCGDTVAGSLRVNDEPQIVLLNLTTGAMKQVSSAPGTRVKYFARISDSWVVWIEVVESADGWPEYRLKAYDRETGRESTLETGTVYELDLSGDIVVWQEWQGRENVNASDIYAQNLRTGQRWTIAEHPASQAYPHISGQWVIYLDVAKYGRREQVADLWAYNLESGEDRLVGQVFHPLDASAGMFHAIDDGKAVWTMCQIGTTFECQFFGVDLDNPTEYFVNMPAEFGPEVFSDNIVAYSGKRGTMELYDLEQGKLVAVIGDPQTGTVVNALFISGDRVVWVTENREGLVSLFAARIER